MTRKHLVGTSSILVLRHVPDEPLGHLADALRRADLTPTVHDLQDPPGTVADHAGLILLGGPQSVNSSQSFVKHEISLIEEALRRGVPVLAICLGAQLLGKALGARVQRCATPEIGFYPIYPGAEAGVDPLFVTLQPQPVFHWHNEFFELPAGAVHLASSELCGNQAFRFGDRAWGLQFHLEIEPATIAQWIAEDAASGDQRECFSAIDPYFAEHNLRRLAQSVFDPWMSLVACTRLRRDH